MDAIGVARQVDPDRADGIVRTGRDHDLLSALAETEARGVVEIVGPGSHAHDGQAAAGRRVVAAADRGREVGDQGPRGVEGPHCAVRLVHLDASDRGQGGLAQGGHQDGRTCSAEIDPGVERLEQGLGDVEAFGQTLARRRILGPGLGLFGKVSARRRAEGAGHIRLGQAIFGGDRGCVGSGQRLDQGRIGSVARAEVLGLAILGDGQAGVLARQAVDLARREAGAIQQDLQSQQASVGRGLALARRGGLACRLRGRRGGRGRRGHAVLDLLACENARRGRRGGGLLARDGRLLLVRRAAGRERQGGGNHQQNAQAGQTHGNSR